MGLYGHIVHDVTETVSTGQLRHRHRYELRPSGCRGFARARLRRIRKIALYYGDSAQVLRRLIDNDVFPEGAGFFYLDAHWDIHLPLKEEVRLIFGAHRSAVVMIDDFEVPDDPGYFFDDYGESGSLTVDYLSETIDRLGLVSFSPSCPAIKETGKKRGMIVLAKESVAVDLRKIYQLREYKRLFGERRKGQSVGVTISQVRTEKRKC